MLRGNLYYKWIYMYALNMLFRFAFACLCRMLLSQPPNCQPESRAEAQERGQSNVLLRDSCDRHWKEVCCHDSRRLRARGSTGVCGAQFSRASVAFWIVWRAIFACRRGVGPPTPHSHAVAGSRARHIVVDPWPEGPWLQVWKFELHSPCAESEL